MIIAIYYEFHRENGSYPQWRDFKSHEDLVNWLNGPGHNFKKIEKIIEGVELKTITSIVPPELST